jgi:hypothetical protein
MLKALGLKKVPQEVSFGTFFTHVCSHARFLGLPADKDSRHLANRPQSFDVFVHVLLAFLQNLVACSTDMKVCLNFKFSFE